MVHVDEGASLEARRVATEAAGRASVRIGCVRDMAGLQVVSDVVDAVWRPPPGHTTVSIEFLRAITHAGNYCAIAWDGDTPLGASLGFLSVEPADEFHSHITGVVPTAVGRHVGRALKLDQRAWALEHGLATIGWTYDPLIRRNAFFNATRLGALPASYLVDFYGEMTDSINAGHASDRVKVTWSLASPRVVEICAGADLAERAADHPDAYVVLAVGEGDVPVVSPVTTDASALLVQVPQDIEALRAVDPALGLSWRMRVRETLPPLMTQGWSVTAFTRDGYYVLTRPTEKPMRAEDI